jgi:hypothetical protein
MSVLAPGPALEAIEQDDEFEEFPNEDWDHQAEAAEDKQLWGDNWDDEELDDTFAQQLRQALEQAPASVAAPAAAPAPQSATTSK